MVRDQMINFLATAVVFLLLTNAFSVLAATYAIRMARVLVPVKPAAGNAVSRRIESMLRRSA